MKRLIYNFDGTSNEYDDAYPTNVVMMQKAVTEISSDGIEQYSFYLKGVGSNTGEKFFGGAFGYGLFENIVAAYTHLCKHYCVGDEIYIFGFSRGAFTARSFAGMIGWCGIIDKDKIDQIENAQTYYKQRLLHEEHHVKKFNQWRMLNSSLVCANADDQKYRSPDHIQKAPKIINIRYIGVWDTVRTLGATDKFYKWHDGDLSSSVDFARHAIALDERRRKFKVTSWDNINVLNQNAASEGRGGTPYQQLWFPGTHGSVGGGGRIRGLSDEAFQWVKEGAKEAGLEFIDSNDAEIFTLRPNPLTWLFNSVGENDTVFKKVKSLGFKTMYWLLRLVDRDGPNSINDVHQSTIVRYFAPSEFISEKKSYRPASLNNLRDAMTVKGSPYTKDQYRALCKTTWQDTTTNSDEKNVNISGIEYLVYMVKKGESLSVIAKKLTGEGRNYKVIHEVNKASIPDEDIIYIGQRILIPRDIINIAGE